MPTRSVPKAEYEEQLAALRSLCPPGTKVYTILRHVSRSGMQRTIDAFVVDSDHKPLRIGWQLAKIGLGTFDRDRGGVKVNGCGMDMGFELVYRLSWDLYTDGFGCIGERCHSNDHSNGDRDYTPHGMAPDHWHREGGYALRQEWV